MMITLYLAYALVAVNHDIHVSVCDIELSQDAVEITIKTYVDDLQAALGLRPGEELPQDYTSSDDLIDDYLSSAVSLYLGDQEIAMTIDDISASNDALWITLEARDLIWAKAGHLQLDYTLLTEVYPDQTNIVNINHKDQKETFSLDSKNITITYVLDQINH